MKAEECILFSGAANGAEAAFGAAAQRHGVAEVNFTFEGHNDARTRGIRVLTEPELKQGDVSLPYVEPAHAPRVPRHAAVPARAPEHLAPGEQRPRGVRGRAHPRRRHGEGRHGLGRRVREALQQAALRVRSGARPLEPLDRGRVGEVRLRPRSRSRASREPARASSSRAARARSASCSSARSGRVGQRPHRRGSRDHARSAFHLRAASSSSVRRGSAARARARAA